MIFIIENCRPFKSGRINSCLFLGILTKYEISGIYINKMPYMDAVICSLAGVAERFPLLKCVILSFVVGHH